VTIPRTFVLFRAAAASATVLLLLLAGFGLAGHGLFHGLGGITSHALSWLRANTGLGTR